MSFSSDVKQRISVLENKCEYCNRAELAAMVKYAGKISGNSIILTSENKAVVQCIKRLILENTGIDIAFEYKEKSRLYEIAVADGTMLDNISDYLMLFDNSYDELIPFDCCATAYIRGAFLGGGSISDPQKSYHLEFDSRHEHEAEILLKMLQRAGISAKITCRKKHHVVYIKEYSAIADVLGVIGDSAAALEIYNISVEKDVRNSINRQINCENANMDKVADAYKKHLAAIEKIKKTIGMDKLPPVLQEIAEIRIKYPEDSLKELGERLENPIGKSGVNHRLNRIVTIAEEISAE